MAFGSSTFSDASSAASDLFGAIGDIYKAKGAEFEKQNYDIAAQFADQNAQYTEWTTRIKEQMQQRATYQALGTANAQIASSGLLASGSALDLLHESAANGLLTKEVLGTQGQITEAGYQEQAQSYRNMSQAAQTAEEADNIAAIGSTITGAIKGAAAVATVL